VPPLPSSWTCPRVLKIRPGKEAFPDFARTGHRPQDQGLALKALNLPSVQDRAPLDKTGEKAKPRPRKAPGGVYWSRWPDLNRRPTAYELMETPYLA